MGATWAVRPLTVRGRQGGRGRLLAGTAIRLAAAVAAVFGLLVVVAGPAMAGVFLGVTPTFPANVSVGQSGLPATLQVTNNATPPDNVNTITLTTITVVPSCGTPLPSGAGDCPAASVDPGVFQTSATATGAAGTACAGTTFTVAVSDPASGKVSFSPSTPVVLQPPGAPGDSCGIDFTVTVLKVPANDSQPAIPGRQTSSIGFASGINNTTNVSGSGSGSSNSTVVPASPTLVTSASAATVVGGQISDSASLSGGAAPTGTVTFSLFSDPACTVPVFTQTVPVAGNGIYTSSQFTTTAVGTYHWVATYSGDANNNSAGPTACVDPAEMVVVSRANTTIATTASPSVPVGGQLHDTATVSGGFNPTGAVTFTLFGPNDATCSGPVVFTSNAAFFGGGATSGNFTATAAGTYRWVASYSGDANNNAAGPTACNDPAEIVVVNRVSPTIATVASPSVPLGGQVHDTATLSGGFGPTGTVTFTAFGPNNPTCSGPAVSTSTVAVFAGAATSPNFTPTAPGMYRYVATYSGDANNDPAGPTACSDPAEAVKVRTKGGIDFNGDFRTDIAVFRPSDGGWYVQGQAGTVWGMSGDIPVPGDYNGDGTTDFAVFRPSDGGWYVQGQAGTVWGMSGDIPVPGDYNGDGTTDFAVYRPSDGAWYIQGQAGAVWGAPGEIPVPGDYNGDGTTDIAVYRPSNGAWYVHILGQAGVLWGAPGDIPVPGDYRGDGQTDFATFRPSNGAWYVLDEGGTFWGASGDTPVPGDYNGDGSTDVAVFRDGAWYIQGQAGAVWGMSGDLPLPLPYAIKRFFP